MDMIPENILIRALKLKNSHTTLLVNKHWNRVVILFHEELVSKWKLYRVALVAARWRQQATFARRLRKQVEACLHHNIGMMLDIFHADAWKLCRNTTDSRTWKSWIETYAWVDPHILVWVAIQCGAAGLTSMLSTIRQELLDSGYPEMYSQLGQISLADHTVSTINRWEFCRILVYGPIQIVFNSVPGHRTILHKLLNLKPKPKISSYEYRYPDFFENRAMMLRSHVIQQMFVIFNFFHYSLPMFPVFYL